MAFDVLVNTDKYTATNLGTSLVNVIRKEDDALIELIGATAQAFIICIECVERRSDVINMPIHDIEDDDDRFDAYLDISFDGYWVNHAN